MRTSRDHLLRVALRIDALGCAVFSLGVVWILLNKNSWLPQLDAPLGLVATAGLIALVGTPLLWSLSRRREIDRKRVWPVIASNLAWALFCIVAVAMDWAHPSKIGFIVIVVQAVMIAAIAEFEWIAIRASRWRNGEASQANSALRRRLRSRRLEFADRWWD